MALGLLGELAGPPRGRPGPSPQVACPRCLDVPSRPLWKLRRGYRHPQGSAHAPAQRRAQRHPSPSRTRPARPERSHHAARRMPARRDRTFRLPFRASEGKQSMRASLARIGEREDPRFPASTARTESSRRPTRERNRLSARALGLLRSLDLSLLRTFGMMRLSIQFFLSGPRELRGPFHFHCVTFSCPPSASRRVSAHICSGRAKAISGRLACALKRESLSCIRAASLPCSSGSAPRLPSRYLFAPYWGSVSFQVGCEGG